MGFNGKMNKEKFDALVNGGADIAPYDHGEEPKDNKEAYETPVPFPSDDSYLQEANETGVW